MDDFARHHNKNCIQNQQADKQSFMGLNTAYVSHLDRSLYWPHSIAMVINIVDTGTATFRNHIHVIVDRRTDLVTCFG